MIFRRFCVKTVSNAKGLKMTRFTRDFLRYCLSPSSVAALILIFAVIGVFLSIIGVNVSFANKRIMPLRVTVRPLGDVGPNDDQDVIAEKLSEPEHTIKLTDADNAGSDEQWRTVRMRVTAYCPCSRCCGKNADGITANGLRIAWGDRFIAADKAYPFGTEMIIPGYNHGRPVKVADRGGTIKANRIDVFYNTHYTASKWGVKYLDVKIKK